MPFAVFAIKRKDVLDLGQRHAHRLAAQDQPQPHPVAPRVGAAAVDAARRQQALVLVEADRAQRDAVFLRQLGDAVELVVGQAAGRRCAQRLSSWRLGSSAAMLARPAAAFKANLPK
jgi:hypothetical protein